MIDFKKFFGLGGGAAVVMTSAAYRAQMSEAQKALAETEATRSEVCSRRQGLLIEADDAALDTLDAEMKKHDRTIERLKATIAELGSLIEVTERDEILAAQAARQAEVEALQRKLVDLLDTEYRAHAEAIANIMLQLVDYYRQVREVRDSGAKLGIPFKPLPPEQVLAARAGRNGGVDLRNSLFLPNPAGTGAFYDGRPVPIVGLGGGMSVSARHS